MYHTSVIPSTKIIHSIFYHGSTNTHIRLAPLQKINFTALFVQQFKNLRKNSNPFYPPPPPPLHLFKQKTPTRKTCLSFIHTLLRQLKMNKTKAFTSPLSTLNINQAARLLNQHFTAKSRLNTPIFITFEFKKITLARLACLCFEGFWRY